MEPNCLICNKIEVPVPAADLTGCGATSAINNSKSDISRSFEVNQIKWQIDRTKTVKVLLKLLYISPTPFLEDVLRDSVICSGCNDRFMSVHQAYTELEVLQGKIAQVRRVIEHDLAASLEQQETSPPQASTSVEKPSPRPLGLNRDVRKYICDIIQPKTINSCGRLPGVGLDKYIHTNNDLICSLDEIDLDPLFGFRMNFPVTQSQLQEDKVGFNTDERINYYNFNTDTDTDTDTTPYALKCHANNKNKTKSSLEFVEKVGHEHEYGSSPGPKSKRRRHNSSQLQNESQMANNENIHHPITTTNKYQNENGNKKQIVRDISRINSDTSIISSSSSSSSASYVTNSIEMKMKPVLVLQKINIDPTMKRVNINKDSKIKRFIIKEKIYIEERKKEVFLKKRFVKCLICNKNVLCKRFNQHALTHEVLDGKKEKCDKSFQLKQSPKKMPATSEPSGNIDGTNAKITKVKELTKNGVPKLKCHDVGKINRNFIKGNKYK